MKTPPNHVYFYLSIQLYFFGKFVKGAPAAEDDGGGYERDSRPGEVT